MKDKSTYLKELFRSDTGLTVFLIIVLCLLFPEAALVGMVSLVYFITSVLVYWPLAILIIMLLVAKYKANRKTQ